VKPIRVVRVILTLALGLGVSACVTGKVLHLPGELARPGTGGAEQGTVGFPTVAVLDFNYAGDPPHEIGRDFDHARTIVWKQDPGKAIPDLIADVLTEKGLRAVRVPAGGAIPAAAAAKVWGSVDKFHVDARKTGSLRMTVKLAASVSITVFGSGGNALPGWSSSVASDYWTEEPFFVTPDGLRNAVNGAANAVAEETVGTLVAAGVISLPPEPSSGTPEGQPPAGAGK
jgi:hypothetical protein